VEADRSPTMDALARIKNTFVDYLSPTAKRRRTIGPETPSNGAREPQYLTPSSEPQGRKTQHAAARRLNKKYLSPSDTKNPRKRAREDEQKLDIKGEDDRISPDESISQKASEAEVSVEEQGSEGGEIDGEEGSDEEGLSLEPASIQTSNASEAGYEAEEIDLKTEDQNAQEKVEEYLRRQAELALRKEEIEKVKAAGDWHPDEIFLYERIAMRSFEPVCPEHWQMDFPTLPDVLFTRDDEKAFVNSNCLSNLHGMLHLLQFSALTDKFSGVKIFQSLLSLGMRIRSNIENDVNTEKLIVKDVKDLIRWSERDGGFSKRRFIPVLAWVNTRPNQSSTSISKSITSQLEFLAERHREHLAIAHPDHINELGKAERHTRTPPLLYGIIIAQTMVIFVTLDSANPNAQIRHLAHADFKIKDMDVWNGFALGFIAIMSRNYNMSILDELEEDDHVSSDIDA